MQKERTELRGNEKVEKGVHEKAAFFLFRDRQNVTITWLPGGNLRQVAEI